MSGFDDDVRDYDPTHYENLMEEPEELHVPDLYTLASEYIAQDFSEEEALAMAQTVITSIEERNREIKLANSFNKAMAISASAEESPLMKKRIKELSEERKRKQEEDQAKEDQEFIGKKREDLKDFLKALSNANIIIRKSNAKNPLQESNAKNPLHDKLEAFIEDPEAVMLADPDGTITKELEKTRYGSTKEGKRMIEKYIAIGLEETEEPEEDDYYDFDGGKKKRKSGKQRKSKKQHKSKKQRKSRKQRK